MLSPSLLEEWNRAKPLIKMGYRVLDKEVTIGIPGVSFPAISSAKNTGIGSPYGEGAEKVAFFLDGVVDKVLLTPTGETFPPYFSPYTGSFGYNPFFIPLEKAPFLSEATLGNIYKSTNTKTKIDYEEVSRNYSKVLREIYKNYQSALSKGDKLATTLSKELHIFIKENPYIQIDAKYYHNKEQDYYLFIEYLASTFIKDAPFSYIGDIPVRLPDSYCHAYPDIFLKGFSLGVPPDNLNKKETNWHFPVINPDKLFSKDGSLGIAGKLLEHIFDTTFKRNKGGLRIDHFIGMVNPFIISESPKYESGRLYSSPDHPIFKKFTKHTTQEFANIAKEIIINTANKNHFDLSKIYIEDIGSRPEQLDAVIETLGLGRMLVSQFIEPENPNHIYRLARANHDDIAVLNTHDMESVKDYFSAMNEDTRTLHARQLAEDLRFNFMPDLSEPKTLIRMKWGELMASPAKRVIAFFTSFTGQEGRFNEPDKLIKWKLRMETSFEENYLKRLKQGLAYNPFDAVCLGIYARGDDFFNQNKDLVSELRTTEQNILNMIT